MNEIVTDKLDWESTKVEGIESKALLSLEGGTFKMIKLRPKASYPLHQHPDKSEFVYVLEGILQATIGDEVYTGGSGVFYRFPVGNKHGLHNPGETETIILVGAIKDQQ